MDIYATNTAERAFSVLILFWALVALSSIIGSVSAAMTALRNMSADENKNFWMLRRYLKQMHIERSLTDRILKYLEFQQIKTHNKVTPGQVKLLASLSPIFQDELAHALMAPFLVDHPFFGYVGQADAITKTALYRICRVALVPSPCAQAEVLFNPGDEGLLMYFVKNGKFEYALSDGKSIDVHLGPKLWFSEACLWTEWRHRGWMVALEPSDAIGLSPAKFSDVFHFHPRPWYMAKHYGTEFVKYMNETPMSTLTDVMFNAQACKESLPIGDQANGEKFIDLRIANLWVPEGASAPVQDALGTGSAAVTSLVKGGAGV